MIRRATDEDVFDVCILCAAFANDVAGINAHPSRYEEVVLNVIRNGVVFVSDSNGVRGVIAGVVTHNPFWDATVLQEAVWYSKDKSGVSLLRAFVKEAKEIKADRVVFTVLEGAIDNRMKHLLGKMGFDPLERNFIMKM